MTSIGLEILNIFSKCLRANSMKRKRILSDRDVYILSTLYDWEESTPNIEYIMSAKLNITRERIRQISIRALRKIKYIVDDDFHPMTNFGSIINSYSLSEEKNYPGKTIVRLCLWEMEGLPTMKMIRLLANLYLPKKSDIYNTIQYYKSHKKALEKEFRKQRSLERKKFLKNNRFSQFLDNHVIWFDKVTRWKKEDFNDKKAKRTVKSDQRYLSGTLHSYKTHQTVQYESGAELSFIQELESSPTVTYYLDQPVTLEYNRKGKQYFYTPDFAVLLNDGRCFLTEIKGNFEDILDARLHRGIEALIDFCEQYGFGILLSVGLHSFDYLINYSIDTALEKVIRDKLNERGGRTIFLGEFREILDQTGAKKTAALAVILKNNWGYYPFPFKLTPRNSYDVFREKIINKFIEKSKEMTLQTSNH